jgi:hypothetical protein
MEGGRERGKEGGREGSRERLNPQVYIHPPQPALPVGGEEGREGERGREEGSAHLGACVDDVWYTSVPPRYIFWGVGRTSDILQACSGHTPDTLRTYSGHTSEILRAYLGGTSELASGCW